MGINLKPGDLDLPRKFNHWKGQQAEVIEQIVNSERPVFLLDAPTGSGKSVIGIASSYIWRTNWLVAQRLEGEPSRLPKRVIYVTRTKQLQDQLLADFPNSRTIKGRANFPCLLNPKKFPELTAEDCPKKGANKCEFTYSCPYLVAKSAALNADIAVLNESYYLTEVNGPGQFSQADFVILDEIDSTESSLMNTISMPISMEMMESFGVAPPEDWEDPKSWVTWTNMTYNARALLVGRMNDQVQTFEDWSDVEIKVNKRATKLSNFNDRLQAFMLEVGATGEFVVQETRDKYGIIKKWDLKPISVRNFAERWLWKHGERFLGMSGTILSPVVLARELGLVEDSFEYQQISSSFPLENRLIKFWPVTNMRKVNMDDGSALPPLLDAIRSILQKHDQVKILIHTASYQVASAILFDHRDNPRVVTHDSANRAEMLDAFKISPDPLVMVSPSFDRGVDLPDDLCRVVIVAKVPYLNLGDKQVAARLKAPGGDQWYVFKAIQTLMQMTGRGVRNETDYCDTYILDSQFNSLLGRTRQYIPKWWLESIRRIEHL